MADGAAETVGIRADMLGTAGRVEAIAAPGRKQFPALDGLRGFAILIVLVYHYFILLPTTSPWLAGFVIGIASKGYVGVDLFFVLSGFLITGILYDAKGQNNYFRNFYARRFLRIFPLYYGVLLAVLGFLLALKFVAPHLWDKYPKFPGLLTAMPFFWTYTTNFGQVAGFQTSALGHFWTLAVEEQFYLVWPLVVFACSRRSLILTCVATIISALGCRLIVSHLGWGQSANYVLTPCQMDALAIGALVAVIARSPGWNIARMARLATVLFGLAAIPFALCFIILPLLRLHLVPWGSLPSNPTIYNMKIMGTTGFHYMGWERDLFYSDFAILFAALLVLALSPTACFGVPHRVFSWVPLRVLGGYSYGIYVFHFIVLRGISTLLRIVHMHHRVYSSDWLTLGVIAINLVVSMGLAFASFHLWEKRFLRLKVHFPERAVQSLASAEPGT